MELKRRKRKPKIKLKRRKKPDVFYCKNKTIKNRLPYPIECSWAASLHSECKGCKKRIIYWYWKKGGYSELNKKLKERKYYPSEADVKAEEEISYIAANKYF